MKNLIDSEKQPSSKKPDEVEDLAEMMKDLKIFQLEKQLAELTRANQRNYQQTNQDQQAEKGQNSTALPFYPPNQYGNRYYPNQQNQQNQQGQQQQYMGQYQQQRPILKGCYSDGGEHSRENCEELRKALECGDVYKNGLVLFLGREDASNNIKVLIPREDGNGRIVWQQE